MGWLPYAGCPTGDPPRYSASIPAGIAGDATISTSQPVKNCLNFKEFKNCLNSKHHLERRKMNRKGKVKELEEQTKRFAVQIIELAGELPNTEAGKIVKVQMVKSGTSIGANYREAKM